MLSSVWTEGSKNCRNVADYWTSADGGDDYLALQRAINAAQECAPSRVYVPGSLSLSQPVRITGPIHLFGDGPGLSVLNPLAGNNCIVIDTPFPVKLSDFDINYPAGATGMGITLQCSDTAGANIYGNSSSVFRDLRITRAQTSIRVNQAQAFVFDNIKSLLHSSVGIQVSNTNWPDAGDSTITNSYIQGANIGSTVTGVLWTGDGAFSLVNSKIITHQYSVLAELQAAAQTRQLFIRGNSLDGASIAAVSLWPLGTGSFGGVIITDNIFNAAANGISAPLPPIGKWINSMVVGQNNWYPAAPSGGVYLDASAVTSLNPGSNDMVMW